MNKVENEIRKLLHIQTEQELIQLDMRLGLSQFQQNEIMKARGRFIQVQSEYLEQIRDNYECYEQLEAAMRQPEISRSWMAMLVIGPAVWEAKERLMQERKDVMLWLQGLRQHRMSEIQDFMFTPQEVREFMLG